MKLVPEFLSHVKGWRGVDSLITGPGSGLDLGRRPSWRDEEGRCTAPVPAPGSSGGPSDQKRRRQEQEQGGCQVCDNVRLKLSG